MLRLDESVPAASNANDDNYVTETKTTLRTVDGYWEVDLGATHALYGLRIIAASGIGYRLTNAIVRLYDEAHDSVHAQKLPAARTCSTSISTARVFARYVRVGLEDKQRTDPSGGIEFYIGFREVEVFGRPPTRSAFSRSPPPPTRLPPARTSPCPGPWTTCAASRSIPTSVRWAPTPRPMARQCHRARGQSHRIHPRGNQRRRNFSRAVSVQGNPVNSPCA
jgi:hypothetical protein